jgi:DNA-binding CsgD family transcriptional regulator
LKPAEVEALAAGYLAGKSMKNLAAEFGIERRTVSAHLRRAQVPIRRGGLDATQAAKVARLYSQGWSAGQLAQRFNVSPNNVLKTLRSTNVTIRPRQGGPRSRLDSSHRT